jgi:hypothetical protein
VAFAFRVNHAAVTAAAAAAKKYVGHLEEVVWEGWERRV